MVHIEYRKAMVSIPLREDILSNNKKKKNKLTIVNADVSIPLREDILSNDLYSGLYDDGNVFSFNSPKGRYLI